MKAIPVFICAILVLGLSAHTTHAQENRKNGEVTLASGEKLSGTFEIKNDRDIYHKILFDGNSSGMNRSYTPKEVNHFSFEDQFFISHPIEVYQVNVGNKFDRSM